MVVSCGLLAHVPDPLPATVVDQGVNRGSLLYRLHNFNEVAAGIDNTRPMRGPDGRVVAIVNDRPMAYDGMRWMPLLNPHGNAPPTILGLAMADNGRIYAGGLGAWGELRPTARGYYEYSPLDSVGGKLTEGADHEYRDIVQTAAGVFFRSYFTVAWQRPGEASQVFEFNRRTQAVFATGGDVFFSVEGSPLRRLVEGSLRPLETWPADFANGITAAAVRDREPALVGTEGAGMWWFDGARRWPFAAGFAPLREHRVKAIEYIEDRFVAVTLDSWGLVILTREGAFVAHIEADQDHLFRNCSYLHYNGDGSLWVTLSSGLAQVYFPSPLTVIDGRHKVDLSWPMPSLYRGRLLVRSNRELYLAEYGAGGRMRQLDRIDVPGAVKIEAIEGGDDEIVFSDLRGVWQWTDEGIRPIQEGVTVFAFHRFPEHPEWLFGVNRDGVFRYEREGRAWTYSGQCVLEPGAHNKVFWMDRDGTFWTERGNSRVLRFWTGPDGNLQGRTYDRTNGLPSGWINLFRIGGVCYFNNSTDVYAFDPVAERFSRIPREAVLPFSDESAMRRPVELSDGSVFVPYDDHAVLLRPDGAGGWFENHFIFAAVADGNLEIFERFAGERSEIYLRTEDTLLRFDPTMGAPPPVPLETQILQVLRPGEIEPLSGGIGFADGFDRGRIPFASSGVGFVFATPYYQSALPVRHQYRLRGLNAQWSEPEHRQRVDFIGLREGSYTLEVRGVSAHGVVGASTAYSFRILPPWYRSRWTLTGGIAALLSALAVIIWSTRRSAEQERARLEAIVSDRTRELNQRNQDLEQMAARAEAANEAKSQFLANMSHEIRTPINGVIATAELFCETAIDARQDELAKIILTSANSLLRVINDVLDYSKIEARKIDLENHAFRVDDILTEVVEILSQVAARKELELITELGTGLPSRVVGDDNRLRQVLLNLGGNAVKFTSRGSVTLSARGLPGSTRGRVRLQFAIEDTGIGIDPAKRSQLFESFSQLDPSDTRSYGGTGLGLAISKGLLDLMGGSIALDPEYDDGCRFTFQIELPIADEEAPSLALEPSEARILLFDTFPRRAATMARVAVEMGYSMEEVSSRDEVRSLLRAGGIDYALIEAPTPVEDETLKLLVALAEAERAGALKRFDVFSFASAPDLRLPADRVLFKPLTTSLLRSRLRSVFSGKRWEPTHRAAPESALGKQVPMRILVAEDNLVNQRVARLILEKLGFTATFVGNGREALEAVQKGRFDLIFMDIQMPEMDGLEATRRIKALGARAPYIVAMTAGAMMGDRADAKAAGVDEFLAKPVRLLHVADAILKASQGIPGDLLR